MKRPAAIALLCIALALSGCGGGAVSVRSNFSGPPIGTTVPTPATPGPNAPKGLFAAGDGDVLLAVIVAMMVLDGLSWVTDRIREAFAEPAEAAEQPVAGPPPVRQPVARPTSWVFMSP